MNELLQRKADWFAAQIVAKFADQESPTGMYCVVYEGQERRFQLFEDGYDPGRVGRKYWDCPRQRRKRKRWQQLDALLQAYTRASLAIRAYTRLCEANVDASLLAELSDHCLWLGIEESRFVQWNFDTSTKSTKGAKARQSRRRHNPNEVTPAERCLVVAERKRIERADRVTAIAAATKIAAQLVRGEFPGIPRIVDLSPDTIRVWR